ncbi:hypothetical protein [Xanthomonas hortorum]|nr:hypothetical protein [Xanthomonas hortorum]
MATIRPTGPCTVIARPVITRLGEAGDNQAGDNHAASNQGGQ